MRNLPESDVNFFLIDTVAANEYKSSFCNKFKSCFALHFHEPSSKAISKTLTASEVYKPEFTV